MWIDNADGTSTAEQGDTLWGKYGSDWQVKSGYTGDPTKLQPGDVVGKADNWSTSNFSLPTTPDTSTDKANNTIKIRAIGAAMMVGGAATVVFAGIGIEKSGGEAPRELGQAVVIGVQAFGLGVAQAASGKDIIGTPFNLFKPILVDLMQAINEGERDGSLDMEKLKS